jgi:hypothetical protein
MSRNRDGDRPTPRFLLALTLLRSFNAMVKAIPDQVHERIFDVL